MSERIARITVVVSLAFAAFALSSCGRDTAYRTSGEGLDWLASMEEALQQAGKKDRPIMIDIYADWCDWCGRLDSDTYSDRDVVAKASDFVSLKLDADANRSIVARYRVGGLPTILFLDPEGKEIHRVIGYKPPDKFVTEMQTALNAFNNGRG